MTAPRKTVLIVDHNPSERGLYRHYLLAEPALTYAVLEADTTDAGLAICRSCPPDAILLDFELPDAGGIAFLSALQSGSLRLPVVVVSNQTDAETATTAFKYGANDYLVKSASTPEAVRCAVRSVIENAQLRYELHCSEERFRTSVENLLDCFGIFSAIRDADGRILDFRIDYLNAAALENNRMTPADIGKPLCQLLPAHRDSGLFDEYCHVVATGEPLIKESLVYADDYNQERLTRAFDIRATKLGDGFVAAWRDITARKQNELDLALAQERLQLAQQAANIGSYDWDIVSNQAVWSEQLEAIYGLSPGSFDGQHASWQALIYPDDRERVEQQLRQALAQQQHHWQHEYRIQRADGELRWLETRGKIYYSPDGQPQRMLGINQDITERKRLEQALHQFEARLGGFVESNVIGILFGDVDGGIHQANDEFLRIVGYGRADLEAGRLRWSELTPDEYLPLDAERVLEARERGACTPYEKEYIRRDGSRVPVLIGYSLVGEARQETVAFVLDLSESKRAEAALRQSEERYRYLAEAIPNLVWTCSATGQCDYVNQRLCDYTGLTPEQAHGLGWLEIVHPQDRDRSYAIWMQAVQSGNSYTCEYRLRRSSDHSYRWHLARGVPLHDANGHVVKWFGTCTDIHDQKQLEAERAELLAREQAAREAAEHANRSKDEFLAVISHELRSPLNSILGWAKLLRTQSLSAADTARALETIERNAKAQSQLIEDLLDISRMMQGNFRLHQAPVQLAAVVQTALDGQRPAAQAKQIALDARFDPTPVEVLGDADRLQQVISNLLSNAIKFTPGGGRVDVSVAAISGDGHSSHSWAQITVRDTGKGINADFLPHVFDRFRQAAGTGSQSHEGLGLGLAIVRQLVELHGGRVWAESAGENQGATFTVRLPLHSPSDFSDPSAASDGSGLAAELKELEASSAEFTSGQVELPLTNIRILLVDDEVDNREFLALLLERNGAAVTTAASVAEALVAFQRWQPDLVVTDIAMPEADGYSLLRQLRALPTPSGDPVPVIALTAYASEQNRLQAQQAGFQGYLIKPAEPAALIAAIMEHLGLAASIAPDAL
ncbi:MAG: PAS domain S-box protein [Synechococcales cyanobacterium M58_A2018_015]|nr:PAS domain S-box protein [Synechococcales cyanobacterium M58_A2018_015]